MKKNVINLKNVNIHVLLKLYLFKMTATSKTNGKNTKI